MRILSFALLAVLAAFSIQCSSIKKSIVEVAEANQYHVGFVLYDPEKKKELISVQADKYFTPASNTKIITLYASAITLGDSIPAFAYTKSGSTIQIWPTGDPSFLYHTLPESQVQRFLTSADTVKVSTAYFHEDRFGPGWSWEDYAYAYSPERSVMPIYGNVVVFEKDSLTNNIEQNPTLFSDSLIVEKEESFSVKREEFNNIFHITLGDCEDCERIRPFHLTDQTLINLLQDTLKNTVVLNKEPRNAGAEYLYSLPVDSVYKHMMQESDNFIAEQLLLVVSGILTDTLRSRIAIDTIQHSLNAFLPDPMNWVDGSGLSRYNLFTPRSLVKLWEELIHLFGQERLMEIVAVGGQAGTIKNLYEADSPYIYGKTGTLRNNHNLSGLLKTKSGKLLLFSYMNNNYPNSSGPIKQEMERILYEIHEKY